jgi:hypothetical protein
MLQSIWFASGPIARTAARPAALHNDNCDNCPDRAGGAAPCCRFERLFARPDDARHLPPTVAGRTRFRMITASMLRKVPLLAEVPDAELAVMAGRAADIHLRANDWLIQRVRYRRSSSSFPVASTCTNPSAAVSA